MSVLRYFDPSVRQIKAILAGYTCCNKPPDSIPGRNFYSQEVRGLISLIYVPLLC